MPAKAASLPASFEEALQQRWDRALAASAFTTQIAIEIWTLAKKRLNCNSAALSAPAPTDAAAAEAWDPGKAMRRGEKVSLTPFVLPP